MISPLLIGLAAVPGAMIFLWLFSLVRRDASIVDVLWGLESVGLTWLYRHSGPEANVRHLFVLALVTIWGVRLALHIFWRNWGTERTVVTKRCVSLMVSISGG